MGLRVVELSTLENNLSKYLEEVITDDKFLKVPTKEGNAVIISEAEWNILVEALGLILKNA